MNWQKAIPAAVLVCTLLAGCSASRDEKQDASESVPNLVTKDIQDGIEKHIEEQTRLGEGYFRLPFDEGELRLKLVRVHTEYLANLGPRRHFACVDLASTDGDVYDVDFFLSGDPGAMTVTETTVHKINGKPFYVWKQKRDKTWHRVPVKDASQRLLGVINDRDEFEFLYRATLPKMTESARMWIPMPSTDLFQTVEAKSIEAPGKREILREREYGNKVLFLTLGPEDSGKTIAMRFQVSRLEKSIYAEQTPVTGQYLDP
ncbi:MAG: transglutaminase domain-containing protein, partial [Planctomycetota bacterium]